MTITPTDKAKRKPAPFEGLSLQQRLPLLICVLLLGITVALSFASYVGVRKASLAIAGERLKTLTEQLSSMFGVSAVVAITETERAAGQSAVRDFLQVPASRHDSSALAALQKLQTDTQALFTELLDLNQLPVLRAGKRVARVDIDRKRVLSDLNVAPDSCRVGKLYLVRDTLYYPIVATVTRDKQTIGHIIRWRLVFATPQALEQFSQLLGTNAALYIGNADGSVWTDLAKPVPAPPVNIQDTGDYKSYSRSKFGPVIAMARPVQNTQWTLLLELSEQKILEGARRFLSWLLVIGAVITVLGIVIAWVMSRNLTRPLKRLTAASVAIAGGNYASPVEVNRRDELGKLARSFNSMAQEITSSKRDLEEKVQQRTAQLENVNKELEAFSYSVSHDLRAPLRAVTGYATILKEDYAGSLDPEARRITDKIIFNAKMMGQLIDDLIEFSKTGAIRVQDELVKMKDLAQSCMEELLRNEAANKYHVQIGDLPDCKGDHNLLKQVWINLISNAIKYSSQAEKATIRIGGREEPLAYTYFISDNGVGFDMKYASKLFGVFQRLHSNKIFQGNGIGLALVKRIISRHHGDIRAEAEPAKGATFYFSIPK